MKIISVVNQKGGCAKTTTAVNLAHAIARKGYRTLLTDLDPQAHATFSLGIAPKLTVADLLEAVVNNRPSNISDYLVARDKHLWVLPSSIGLSALEHTLAEQNDKLRILTKAFLSTMSFDFFIIDCPPSLGILTLNAIVASSYTIVPVGICNLSLKGVDNLNNIFIMLAEHGIKTPFVFYLITQLDKRLNFSETFTSKAKEKFANKLLPIMIRTNVHLREAAAAGKSIFEYRNDSRGAQDYRQLAEEVEKITSAAEVSKIQLSIKDRDFKEVYVVGEFNDWQKDKRFQLKRTNAQAWNIILPLRKGTYRYKFVVDDNWINDPENRLEENDSFGGKNSLLFVR